MITLTLMTALAQATTLTSEQLRGLLRQLEDAALSGGDGVSIELPQPQAEAVVAAVAAAGGDLRASNDVTPGTVQFSWPAGNEQAPPEPEPAVTPGTWSPSLTCPDCGEIHTHVTALRHLPGQDRGAWEGRGPAAEILMNCEQGHEWTITYGQHKGQTHVVTRSGHDVPGTYRNHARVLPT